MRVTYQRQRGGLWQHRLVVTTIVLVLLLLCQSMPGNGTGGTTFVSASLDEDALEVLEGPVEEPIGDTWDVLDEDNETDTSVICEATPEVFETAAFVRLKGVPEDLSDEDKQMLSESFEIAYNNLASCPQQGSVRLVKNCRVADVSTEVKGFAGTSGEKKMEQKKPRKMTLVLEMLLECNSCKTINVDGLERAELFFEDIDFDVDANDNSDNDARRRLADISDGNNNNDGDATLRLTDILATAEDRGVLLSDNSDSAAQPSIAHPGQHPEPRDAPTKKDMPQKKGATAERTADHLDLHSPISDANKNSSGRLSFATHRMLKKHTLEPATVKTTKNSDEVQPSTPTTIADPTLESLSKTVTPEDAGTEAESACQDCRGPHRGDFKDEFITVLEQKMAEVRRSRALQRDASTAAGLEKTRALRGLSEPPPPPGPGPTTFEIGSIIQVQEDPACTNTTDLFETFTSTVAILINTNQVNVSDPDDMADLKQDIIAAYNELNYFSQDTCDKTHRQLTAIERRNTTRASNKQKRMLQQLEEHEQPRHLRTYTYDATPSYSAGLYALGGICISCANSFSFSNDITFQYARHLESDPRYKIDWDSFDEDDVQWQTSAVQRSLNTGLPLPPPPSSSLPPPGEPISGVSFKLCYCPVSNNLANRAPLPSEALALLDEDASNTFEIIQEVQETSCPSKPTPFNATISLDNVFASFLNGRSVDVLSDEEREAFEECAIVAYEVASLEVCDSNFVSIMEATLTSASDTTPTITYDVKAQCRGCNISTVQLFDTLDGGDRRRNRSRNRALVAAMGQKDRWTQDLSNTKFRNPSVGTFAMDDSAENQRQRRALARESIRQERSERLESASMAEPAKPSSTSPSMVRGRGRNLDADNDGDNAAADDDESENCYCDVSSTDDLPASLSAFEHEIVKCVNEQLGLDESYP